ncbi:MAG: ABC transporter ATP-binding protein [Nitrospirae bacterium]|nr:ABC transporter ATP-binding protein [Nitrospirota bacterium]
MYSDGIFPTVNQTAHQSVLQAKGLRKVYGSRVAVDGIGFSFEEGEFIGFLGPNGAGKTTTIKMLTGLVKPTGGEITYFGKDFFANPRFAKRIIGAVPQQNNLDRDLTAYENLKLHAILYGMDRSGMSEKIGEMLTFAGLTNYRDMQVKTFSGGTMRRLVIARALLHEPGILFLDEPTVGLDPQIRRSIWEFIVKVNNLRNTTIILTTHYIEEAERLCRRVLIINDGKIIAEGRPDEMKKEIGQYVLEIYMEEGINERFFESREDAVIALRDSRYPCKVREVTLEDVFLKITGRRINV